MLKRYEVRNSIDNECMQDYGDLSDAVRLRDQMKKDMDADYYVWDNVEKKVVR